MWTRNGTTYSTARSSSVTVERWWKGRYAVEVNGEPVATRKTLTEAQQYADTLIA